MTVTFLWVSLIVTLLVVSWFIFLKNPDNKRIEQFTSASIDDKVKMKYEHQKPFRDRNALQSCLPLRPSSEVTMTSESLHSMKTMLDGHRINLWKPAESDSLLPQLHGNSMEYCYILDDSDNGMQDFTLVKEGCSMSNALFSNTPIIHNVYKTSSSDKTHALPLAKCVLEIDTSKTTDSNLNSFWAKWGSSKMCDNITDPLKHDLSQITADIDSFSHKYNVMNNDIQVNDENYEQHVLKSQECYQTNQLLTEDIRKITSMYGDIIGQYEIDEKSRREKVDRITETTNAIQDLETAIQKSKLKLDELTEQHSVCRTDNNNCLKDKFVTEEAYEAESTLYNLNSSQHNNLANQLKDLTQRYEELIVPTAECIASLAKTTRDQDEMLSEYMKVKNLFMTCIDKRNLYNDLSQQQVKEFQLMDNDKVKCLTEREVLRSDSEVCKTQKQRCDYLQAEFINVHNILKAIKEKYETCDLARNAYRQTKKEIEQQNVALYNELDKLLEDTREQQRTIHNQEIDQVLGHSGTLWNQNREALHSHVEQQLSSLNCGNKTLAVSATKQLEIGNAQMEYQITALNNELCKYCTPTVDQCATHFKHDNLLCFGYNQQHDVETAGLVTTNP